MVRFLADENFSRPVVLGLLRRRPETDVAIAQDVLPEGTPDPEFLAFAAEDNRIVLSHDNRTMRGFADARVARGERMPGLFLTNDNPAVGAVIEDLVLIAELSLPEEWANRVVKLPFSRTS